MAFQTTTKQLWKPSNVLGASETYDAWARETRLFLESLNLFKYVERPVSDAALGRPADPSDREGPTHRQLELIVMGHIMRGIKNQRLVAKVLPYKRPHEVWHAVKPPSSQHNEEDMVAQLRALRFSDFRSLDDYLAEIYKLRNAIWRTKSGRDRVPEQEVLRTIVNGLPKEIFREIQLEFFRRPDHFTLNMLEHRLYEQVEFETQMSKNDVHRSSTKRPTEASFHAGSRERRWNPPGKCFNCGDPSHFLRDCPRMDYATRRRIAKNITRQHSTFSKYSSNNPSANHACCEHCGNEPN